MSEATAVRERTGGTGQTHTPPRKRELRNAGRDQLSHKRGGTVHCTCVAQDTLAAMLSGRLLSNEGHGGAVAHRTTLSPLPPRGAGLNWGRRLTARGHLKLRK